MNSSMLVFLYFRRLHCMVSSQLSGFETFYLIFVCAVVFVLLIEFAKSLEKPSFTLFLLGLYFECELFYCFSQFQFQIFPDSRC